MKNLIYILLLTSVLSAEEAFSRSDFNDVLHVSGSAMLFMMSYETMYNNFNTSKTTDIITATLITITAGMAKEIYDQNTNGYFNPVDVCLNTAGLAIGFYFVTRF